ncbi:unnamed protein product [Lymnaea stagnalis]|uniref:Ig-like domain-containing protein n=1 Tax=Lymnaea stagnalis TaxID=6523 RepID=A0AAV2I991_LYMST
MKGHMKVTKLLVMFIGFSFVTAQDLISSFEVNGQTSVLAKMGDRLEYYCMSYGSSVSWTLTGQRSGNTFFDDDTVTSGSLTVGHPATCLDNDTYQCTARSNVAKDVKFVDIKIIGC